MGERYLGFFVFVAGAAVMAVEMAASRLLAPFFGSSLVVWANLIGIILIGLSLGYWAGGRLADRRADRPGGRATLFDLAAAAGLLLTLIPAWTRPFFAALQQGIWTTSAAVLIGSFFGAAFAFFPPIFLLGMLSPYALRLATRTVDSAGRVAGRLYALSTAGSLFGVYAASFGMIPFLGTRATILIWAGVLLLAAAYGRRRVWAYLLVLVPLFFLIAGSGPVRARPGLVFEAETAYQFVQVSEDARGRRYLYVNEGGGVQSTYDPAAPLTGWYTDFFAVLPFLTAEPLHDQARILAIGVAGATIATTYARTLRGSLSYTLEGVEIDPALIEIAHRYFGLKAGDMRIYTGDGRMFLARRQRDDPAYDVVVVDAYTREIYVPFHLASRQFFQSVADNLAAGGLVCVNVNAASPTSPLLRNLVATLRSVFPHVALVRVPASLNYLLIGSEHALPIAGLPERVPPVLRSTARRFVTGRLEPPAGGIVFTDDRAPTELLTDWMVFELGVQRVKME